MLTASQTKSSPTTTSSSASTAPQTVSLVSAARRTARASLTKLSKQLLTVVSTRPEWRGVGVRAPVERVQGVDYGKKDSGALILEVQAA